MNILKKLKQYLNAPSKADLIVRAKFEYYFVKREKLESDFVPLVSLNGEEIASFVVHNYKWTHTQISDEEYNKFMNLCGLNVEPYDKFMDLGLDIKPLIPYADTELDVYVSVRRVFDGCFLCTKMIIGE